MTFGYEKLEVAKIAKGLITDIYKISGQFPNEERYGLVSQLRRAIVSVLLNIAEGSGRKTPKDFAKFVRISIGSLIEVHAALQCAIELEYMEEWRYEKMEPAMQELYFKLIGLEKYLLNKS
ncbi:MAG: four helix bundle protein [Candidatus Magasanikbacteria bacterium CG_4_9_14_0_2_um_filter_42_11]|uniref:Four helix bundle protein n=1 Tax=Candidatus Magasanikbacteria bacterium CG_4_9_14_0_2_um_filter_42_11 TaxID=1974643 RepID=A0A2M8F9X8_9BACT|nr:MAG: four helix bundle protein [Candidatus Magasanikbacteria bacterium CG10_big_fil_rev_8_21_14_0_10_43_9]PIY92733.1 MAG: four helix bundle protein [Candidatus Magasanikbacteria bacterium CG_4_10_14_0_8_um_filter_42_12]PJC52544.1 MAG: four helix bundle protein [Candidatus Magasanikbacteria bacterium CG_4_9_14_0_2_um_filter_42_11]